MNKELFTTAADLIKSSGTINSVRLWNAEIWEKTDILDRFPIVFLEFSNLNYNTLTGKVQECNNAQMTVHILYKTLHAEDTNIMDLAQEIFVLLQRGGYARITENPEYSNQEVIDWQITFDCPRFEDHDAAKNKINVKKIDVELNISRQ